MTGQNQVNPRSGNTALGFRAVEGVGQVTRQQGGMDVYPSGPRTQQLGQKGANRTAATRCATIVPGGEDGAVEVAQQQGGDLQVKTSCEVHKGIHETGPLHRAGWQLKGGMDGQKEEAKRQARAGSELHCMEAAGGMEHTPSCTTGEDRTKGDSCAGQKPHTTGPAMDRADEGWDRVAMMKRKRQPLG